MLSGGAERSVVRCAFRFITVANTRFSLPSGGGSRNDGEAWVFFVVVSAALVTFSSSAFSAPASGVIHPRHQMTPSVGRIRSSGHLVLQAARREHPRRSNRQRP